MVDCVVVIAVAITVVVVVVVVSTVNVFRSAYLASALPSPSWQSQGVTPSAKPSRSSPYGSDPEFSAYLAAIINGTTESNGWSGCALPGVTCSNDSVPTVVYVIVV